VVYLYLSEDLVMTNFVQLVWLNLFLTNCWDK